MSDQAFSRTPAVGAQASAVSGRNRIADLNDRFRRSFVNGRVMITAGVAALPAGQQARLLRAIQAFDAFDANDDPYAEHDFGAVQIDDVRCFWKIDAYDRSLTGGSPDPTNPAVTVLVLTIMLAAEY